MNDYELLTDDERGHYRHWESLFESEGWGFLTKELRTELEEAPTELFFTAKSWEEVLAARARMRAVAELLSYPKIIEQRKDHLMHSRTAELQDRLEADRPDV